MPTLDKIVSRKQWRFLSIVLEDWEKCGKDVHELGYDRETLRELLAETDYDALPEKAGDPKATPRPKAHEPRPCACGRCGLTFAPAGTQAGRKYHMHCPNRKYPKNVVRPLPDERRTAVQMWSQELGGIMWVKVEVAPPYVARRVLVEVVPGVLEWVERPGVGMRK
jgi:hypothetical protein